MPLQIKVVEGCLQSSGRRHEIRYNMDKSPLGNIPYGDLWCTVCAVRTINFRFWIFGWCTIFITALFFITFYYYFQFAELFFLSCVLFLSRNIFFNIFSLSILKHICLLCTVNVCEYIFTASHQIRFVSNIVYIE